MTVQRRRAKRWVTCAGYGYGWADPSELPQPTETATATADTSAYAGIPLSGRVDVRGESKYQLAWFSVDYPEGWRVSRREPGRLEIQDALPEAHLSAGVGLRVAYGSAAAEEGKAKQGFGVSSPEGFNIAGIPAFGRVAEGSGRRETLAMVDAYRVPYLVVTYVQTPSGADKEALEAQLDAMVASIRITEPVVSLKDWDIDLVIPEAGSMATGYRVRHPAGWTLTTDPVPNGALRITGVGGAYSAGPVVMHITQSTAFDRPAWDAAGPVDFSILGRQARVVLDETQRGRRRTRCLVDMDGRTWEVVVQMPSLAPSDVAYQLYEQTVWWLLDATQVVFPLPLQARP